MSRFRPVAKVLTGFCFALIVMAVGLPEALNQREDSVFFDIEAAARNEAAIRLYRKLGYDCLNTITIRKDFPGYEYDVVRKEKIHGMEFEIRKDKDF